MAGGGLYHRRQEQGVLLGVLEELLHGCYRHRGRAVRTDVPLTNYLISFPSTHSAAKASQLIHTHTQAVFLYPQTHTHMQELMTKLITETPDHPIPFLIDHLQTKQDSPGKLHRALSGSAALWAQSSPESKNTRREYSNYEKPWQIHPKKPKKSKSDLAVSSISPPSPETKSLPRSGEYPPWDWRESRDFDELNHILQESKKLGKALESLSRSEWLQHSRALPSLMSSTR
ncbi:hypothetical protein PAMP_011231 [Pampus punctatissimus]